MEATTYPLPPHPEVVVYLLRRESRFYIGATNNLERRLRQHNGLITGGSPRTLSYGPGWELDCYVTGFRTFQEGLKFESAWKRQVRRVGGGYASKRRRDALGRLLALERWSSTSPPASEVDLVVHYVMDGERMEVV